MNTLKEILLFCQYMVVTEEIVNSGCVVIDQSLIA